jgi:type 1 glutamine amidotransferase
MNRRLVRCAHLLVAAAAVWLLAGPACPAEAAEPKLVLLLGAKRDHPPGTHEYMAGVKVLAKCLVDVPGLKVEVIDVTGRWPEGPEKLAKADGIVMYLGEGGKWMQEDAARWEAVRALAARGGAIVGLHWGIGARDDKYIEGHLKMMGGMHGGSDRKYTFTETDVKVVAPGHPVAAGVEKQFRLNDEYYYNLKFAKEGKVTPILDATIEGKPETCAWVYERPDGGRSFGFACMHNHVNWALPNCRRLVAQGVVWALGLPVPEGGLPVEVRPEDLELPR